MVVTDEKDLISAKKCTALCTVHLRFWKERPWTRASDGVPSDEPCLLHLTGVFLAPPFLAATCKDVGSLCLHRDLHLTLAAAVWQDNKSPSLLLSHTPVKEFTMCSYVAGDCTTAGFDGWITAANAKTSVPVSVKLLSLSAPKWLLCIWKYMWFPAAFLLTSPLQVLMPLGLGRIGNYGMPREVLQQSSQVGLRRAKLNLWEKVW